MICGFLGPLATLICGFEYSILEHPLLSPQGVKAEYVKAEYPSHLRRHGSPAVRSILKKKGQKNMEKLVCFACVGIC